MKLLFLGALLLLPCGAAAGAVPRRPAGSRAPGRAQPRGGFSQAPTVPPTSVWPAPQSMTLGSSAVWLDASFEFNCAAPLCPAPLDDAFTRYDGYLFFAGPPAPLPTGAVAITGLNITVAADAPLTLGVSENYTLTVPSAGGVALATADTQWGALRAIETFTQLFQWQGNAVPIAYGLASAPVAVTDFPRWPWRGALIDSSRHFLTPASIKTTLEAMAFNKLNAMHWHLVDDVSWPLVSTTLPLMSQKGAYSPEATYSHSDIEDIVRFANARGIRVIPEFDMPAHASIWGAGYPEFVIVCSDGQTLLNPVPSAGLYDAVDKLLFEFMPLFKTDVIHFGGDEVQNLQCWTEDAGVKQFMKDQGFTTVDEVRNYFETRIQNIALSHSASSMLHVPQTNPVHQPSPPPATH